MSRLVIKRKNTTYWKIECGVITDRDTKKCQHTMNGPWTKAEAVQCYQDEIISGPYDYVDLLECDKTTTRFTSKTIRKWKRVREEDLREELLDLIETEEEEPCDRCPSESLSHCESNGCQEEKTREELLAEWKWETESHKAIDWVFEGWSDDDVEECDKYDPGAVAVYFRKKKPE